MNAISEYAKARAYELVSVNTLSEAGHRQNAAIIQSVMEDVIEECVRRCPTLRGTQPSKKQLSEAAVDAIIIDLNESPKFTV